MEITDKVFKSLDQEAQIRGYGPYSNGISKMLGCSVQLVHYVWLPRTGSSPVRPNRILATKVKRILAEHQSRKEQETTTLQNKAGAASMVVNSDLLSRLSEKVTIVGKVKNSFDVNGTPAHVVEVGEYHEGDTVLVKKENGQHTIVRLQSQIAMIPV
jgi:hypothetical protein